MSTNKVSTGPLIDVSASDVREKAKGKLAEVRSAAAQEFEKTRSSAVHGLEQAADGLRSGVGSLHREGKLSDLTRSTADKVEAAANYLRRNDVHAMANNLEDLIEDFVKRNPVTAMLIAAGTGFLIVRAIRSGSHG